MINLWKLGAKLVIWKGDRLDPEFESWCVRSLRANVHLVPDEATLLWGYLDKILERSTVLADLKGLKNRT